MTAWTVPYAQRSMKTVSGFSPSSFLAASMTGSITNILLNAMVACVFVLCYLRGKEKKQCDVLELIGGTFRSCSKVVMKRDQSINRDRLRKKQVGDYYRRSD